MSRTVDACQQSGTDGSRPLLRRAAVVIAATVALLLLLSAPVLAQAALIVPLPSMTEGWTQVVTGGLHRPGNSHVTFSTSFGATTTSAPWPAKRQAYRSERQAKYMQRTADGITWEQIGTAGLGDPANIMFDLVVFRDQLYALSFNVGGRGWRWSPPTARNLRSYKERLPGDPKNRAAVPLVLGGRPIPGRTRPRYRCSNLGYGGRLSSFTGRCRSTACVFPATSGWSDPPGRKTPVPSWEQTLRRRP